jgi:hypothetical protein
MKKNPIPILFVFFVLFNIHLKAQSFNDTIFTKTSDTIICQITMVNNHNIFYQYPKKRRTKAGNISRDLVLSYSSSNPKLVEIINRPKYPKCDTCNNWIVLNTEDTIYYNIKLSFINDKYKIVKGVNISTPNSITTLNIDNISAIKWDSIIYKSLKLSIANLEKLKKMAGIDQLDSKSFISSTIVEGKIPLKAFCFTGTQIYYVGTISVRSVLDIQYYIIKDNEIVLIPHKQKDFKQFIQENLSDHNNIIISVNKNWARYKDTIEIFEMYNNSD